MARRLSKRFILVVILLLLLRYSTLQSLKSPLAIRLSRTTTSTPLPNLPYSINKTSSASHDLFHTLPNQSAKNNIPAILFELARCTRPFNKFTNHVRLPNHLYNISMSTRGGEPEARKFWNPTIFALPSWSTNEYLIVTMVDCTNRGYRQNVICEANICVPKHKAQGRDNICTEDDLKVLGSNGGLRCATPPVEVDLPATPAKKCEGEQEGLADIPGFHDPRIFYTSRGEPILTVASQSRYACIGVWAIDLRSIRSGLEEILSSSPKRLGPGPVASYPGFTELTRNPPETRRSYEKNWLIFSLTPASSYVQYELTSSQRTFGQLIGGGFTTPNLTDPTELPCLVDVSASEISKNKYMANATWHQATPALKVILCNRSDSSCNADTSDIVFIAAIHRKHKNHLDLPIRYERYFVIWAATPPFNMLAVSHHPMLFSNETTTGWTAEESWDDVSEAREEGRGFWAKLTYTTTIAYAWGREEGDVREMGVGFLDDEVMLSVGIDDIDQVYGKVLVSDLLQCLRICPGLI
ncbi:hypothetical protein CJF32_00001293 [Rutstroemia sp. NJR-2017a WRK4]|nr:hypothetical protein CJF32_00001293 [Rutstroemia sp. NJR-2017a WRK4]